MGFLGDVLGLEKFNLGEVWDKIKTNPERLLLGALDPASSKVWGKVLGKDYEPAVDAFGGPTKQTYDKANASGINTGPGQALHDVAKAVVVYKVGGNLAASDGSSAPTGSESSPTWKRAMSSSSGLTGGTQQTTQPIEPYDTTPVNIPEGCHWDAFAKQIVCPDKPEQEYKANWNADRPSKGEQIAEDYESAWKEI